MDHRINLEDVLVRASEKRIYLDTLFLLILLLSLFLIFGGKHRGFGIAVFVLVFVFTYNEVGVQRWLFRREHDDQRSEVILRNTTTNIQLPSIVRLAIHLPIIISGFIQAINRMRKDETFRLTREIGASIISQAPEILRYRPLTHPMPKKVIYLMQHVTAVLDNCTFLQFIPEGYRLRVLNKGNANPLGLFPKTSRRHLFGAHFLEMESPEKLKESVRQFVEYMIQDTEPTVYCIWPTGSLWKRGCQNGIEEFKPGAFFMSCFTGIPVTIIHTKVSGLVRNMIVEQSPLHYPPKMERGQGGYLEFYENPQHRSKVLEFRTEMEKLYREMDDRLEEEIGLGD